MHFTWVDSDYVARTGLDETTAARRFLRAALDQPHAELLMGMAAKDECGVRFHGFDAASSAAQQLESSAFHSAHCLRVPIAQFHIAGPSHFI